MQLRLHKKNKVLLPATFFSRPVFGSKRNYVGLSISTQQNATAAPYNKTWPDSIDKFSSKVVKG